MEKGIGIVILLLLTSVTVLSQDLILYNFDDGIHVWNTKKGKAEIVEQGAYSHKALRLVPNTTVVFELLLRPASSYKLVAWMRTESGTDDMSMQITNLGRNNIGITNALATWTRFERIFNVSDNQVKGNLEFTFDNSQGNTFVWIDEISVQRIGDYKEMVYDGIPEVSKREVRTDLGLEMQPDEKITWMLDDKLGMFIHWGLYAGPAKGEWYMENNGISPDEYRKLAYPESGNLYFDAKDFDPRKWVSLAKKMGARYMNMTTQHHDGYALFESKYMNAFTSKQTHNRDFVREYVDACRQAGMKVGIYKTLINWRFPGYYDVTGEDCKSNKFGYTTDVLHRENARLMKEELYCQTKELVTKYGKIDQLFWDGGWLGQKGSDAAGAHFWESGKYMSEDNQWPINAYFQDVEESTGKALGLMGMVRKYQPDIVANVRSGWIGDYTNEEGGGAVKGEIRNGVVEKCFTLAPGWGYTTMMEDSSKIMSLRDIKRIFADCMIRNMCCMINVGPDRHGNVPRLIEQRLQEFGDWVNITGEAIFGTRGGPWQPVDGEYGFCYRNNVIYIYFLGGYTADSFVVPPVNVGMKVVKAYNVLTKEKIRISQSGRYITLKGLNPIPSDLTVIAVVLNKNVR
jgi:alpha-L-fucosidase